MRIFAIWTILTLCEASLLQGHRGFHVARVQETFGKLRGGGQASPDPIQFPSHNGPKELVKLRFECFNLKSKDYLSKSDPMILLFTKYKHEWKFIGRTEPLANNLNPVFKESIFMEYTFEAKQPIRIVVLDIDDPLRLPSDPANALPLAADNPAAAAAAAATAGHDLLGCADAFLADVVGSRESSLTLPLSSNSRDGPRVRVRAEEIAESARPGDILALSLRGHELAAKDGPFGLSDPFLVLRSLPPTGGGKVGEEVARTEVLRGTLEPVWAELRVDLLALCGGDLRRPLRLECWDWDLLSAPDSIGDADATAHDLLAGRPIVLRDRKGRATMVGRCGTITASAARIERMPSLLDYLAAGGCTVSLTVAVDFTASNGDPLDPTSLHRLVYDPAVHKTRLNEYQRALTAVGEVLAPYDSDGRIAAFGFGGIPAGGAAVSFCFPLNGRAAAPEVAGLPGLLDAYAAAARYTRLHGPTNMAEVVARVADLAREQDPPRPGGGGGGGALRYHVLLILTDGAISDLPRTEAALAAASGLPLSVIIVGVRNRHHREDFGAMRLLDADADAGAGTGDGSWRRRRDLVQFVALDEDGGGGGGGGEAEDAEALARRVLAEVPAQLVGYFAGLRRRRPPAWERADAAGAHYELPPPAATRAGVEALAAAAAGRGG